VSIRDVAAAFLVFGAFALVGCPDDADSTGDDDTTVADDDVGDDDSAGDVGQDDDVQGDDDSAYGLCGEVTVEDGDIVITADTDGTSFGRSVAGIGDNDADGFLDFAVGAPGFSSGYGYAGAVFVFRGPPSEPTSTSNAVAVYHGEAGDSQLGEAIAGVGDVDADGYDDLIVAGYGYQLGRGATYLLLGPCEGENEVTVADAAIYGENQGDYSGSSVASAGDVDGDGTADWIIGAGGQSRYAYNAGAAYIWHGTRTSGSFDLSEADAALYGTVEWGTAGNAVAGDTDLNGDGLDDVLVGAWQDSTAGHLAGAIYLFLAPIPAEATLDEADAIVYASELDHLGVSVAASRDSMLDGRGDWLAGAYMYSEGDDRPGAAFLQNNGLVETQVDTGGFSASFTGEAAYDGAGSEVAFAGDVDGNGTSDLLVGAEGRDGEGDYYGAAYLIYADDIVGTHELSEADFIIRGTFEHQYTGHSLAGAGDLDSDGHADFLVGAPGDPNSRGSVAIFMGESSSCR